MPDRALAHAINALLDRQPAARARLQQHAGQALRIDLPLHAINLLLDPDGHLTPAPADALPSLTLTPDPAALPRWLAGGDLADLFTRTGDSHLAADLGEALAAFDWVLALRPHLGDIAAARIDQWFRDFGAWRRAAMDSVGHNLAEYAVHEAALLAEPHAVRAFIAGVDQLRDDAARLAARLALLERRAGR